MPEFLSTRGVTSKIEDLISNARNTLFLISPYLSYLPESMLSRVKEAIANKVRVILVFRSVEKIHLNELEKIKAIDGLEIFQNENLHAKAYFNEKEAVVTSFNLSGYSEANNIEFGIHFTLEGSKEMFEKMALQTKLLIQESKPLSRKDLTPFFFDDEFDFQFGKCIRCGTDIPPDPESPFCFNCYDVWRIYENYNYVEKYCHQCGKPSRTSMAKPICDECF